MRITEPQMFRAVVIVGLAMIPVILLAAAVGPLAGAILLGVELVLAMVVLVKRFRTARGQGDGGPAGDAGDTPGPLEDERA